ncbi:G5 domain-containing protein [Bifidobacterium panos]|uniref:Lytic transglycosylase n=1 Tax=Bifidobacterium panos TaxID=2675321 RepID=A0ABX1SZK1_9BIFI|nr:G5 domain-containing protein [Bifidobacterium sp. DSM 109963]NMN02709.1 lytic transglycosylase [Bifidobacterium sp. DSM 109963]
MARRWTPRRFVTLRRVRVVVCVVATAAVCAAMFAVSSNKAVALNINGETTTVRTCALSVERLLEEQGVTIRSHDLVESSSGNMLADRAVVTVRSAYQITMTVNGEEIPFWTVADSADQLIGFFKANESKAAEVSVNIGNIYNQLTGGLVINKDGPVTVIADGKTSEAPNGKLPAASILDSKGISVGKEDRISVEQDAGKTILRVKRVTHGQETRSKTVAFDTRTVTDSSLQPGETKVVQQGQNGETRQVYNVTYVDGVAESETLESETTVTAVLDQIVAVGPERAESSDEGNGQADADTSDGNKDDTGNTNNTGKDSDKADKNDSDTADKNTADKNTADKKQDDSKTDNGSDGSKTDADNANSDKTDSNNTNSGNTDSGNTGNTDSGNTNTDKTDSGNTDSSDSGTGGLWHPSVAQAQTYAAAASAQRGWTDADWDALVWLWNHESGWRWNAENPSSGAYGIPQALPPEKMGANYRDDAAVQIDWGLNYIANRYGSPSKAKEFWLEKHWY